MFKNSKIYNQDLITKVEKKTFEKKDSFSVMQFAAKSCSNYILSNYKPEKVLITGSLYLVGRVKKSLV